VIQKCWRWCHVHSLRENRNHQNVYHSSGNAFLCPLRVQHRLAPTNALPPGSILNGLQIDQDVLLRKNLRAQSPSMKTGRPCAKLVSESRRS
jgi:hypothetical protein